ncbi:MAG: chloride channel protein, partial [Xanthomonadales bacterium]|nr:chloride channel protein [Xanthomonadales bacterium]
MDQPAPLPIDDHHVLLSPQLWKRRIALWCGAVLVALAAILFARASDYSYEWFKHLLAQSRYWPLIVTPIGFALLAWLTHGALRSTRGSGIPQVIAAMNRDHDVPFRDRLVA